ncbi:MAG: peptidyl-prolyl cis-trans isomerase [Proteobacteria bacterium]|nr:peptidyl-prolyl cis-trans isomerase [Pseudomonadota bacterium]
MSGGKKAIRGILRQPALHFALIGVAIFAIHGWLRSGSGAESSIEDWRDIVISGEFITGLRHDHRRRTGVDLSPEEQTHHIYEFVRQEVLFREAIALGLDRADLVIRRRLVQKMEFLVRDMAGDEDPTEAELREYLAEHADDFRIPANVGFRHIFVASGGNWQHARNIADKLAGLPDLGSISPLPGDPFPLGSEFVSSPVSRLERGFGSEFVAALRALRPGQWSRPIRSQYGWHLVWVTTHSRSRLPTLAEIRDRVANDWRKTRRAEAQTRHLSDLMARYHVRIEEPADRPGGQEFDRQSDRQLNRNIGRATALSATLP